MAYIDREKALQIIDNYAKTVTEDGKVIVDAVRDIVAVITPTADVVEVVRCEKCSSSNLVGDVLYCSYFNKNVSADGFCSEGG